MTPNEPDTSRIPRRNAMAKQWFTDRFGPGAIADLPGEDYLEVQFGSLLDAADLADPLRRGLAQPSPGVTYRPAAGWTAGELPVEPGTVIQFEGASSSRIIATLNIKGNWNVMAVRISAVVHQLNWDREELLQALGSAPYLEIMRHRSLVPA